MIGGWFSRGMGRGWVSEGADVRWLREHELQGKSQACRAQGRRQMENAATRPGAAIFYFCNGLYVSGCKLLGRFRTGPASGSQIAAVDTAPGFTHIRQQSLPDLGLNLKRLPT